MSSRLLETCDEKTMIFICSIYSKSFELQPGSKGMNPLSGQKSVIRVRGSSSHRRRLNNEEYTVCLRRLRLSVNINAPDFNSRKQVLTMAQVAKKILVTCALPYANGSIHLGHMLEHIQADVWVRYQRMRGHEVHFICADDAHGTPIMLKAQQLGIEPEQMIAEMSQEHQKDFAGFGISYDNYHSTHSDENRVLSELIYGRLKENGFIKNRTISQLYDPEKEMFLPDRFVKGTCPKCHSPNQYGDNCEVCGATYSPTDLINPVSVLSGATPIQKESLHYFFDLEKYTKQLEHWLQSHTLQTEITHKLHEWFKVGLQAWDISRDAPYFGFEI